MEILPFDKSLNLTNFSQSGLIVWRIEWIACEVAVGYTYVL